MIDYQRVAACIDMDALQYNMRNIRKKVPEGIHIMGVVKADAYGHGAVETAEFILQNGADCLAVAAASEALQLRNHGIKAPILILGFTPNGKLSDIVENDIIQTVYDYQTALALSEEASKQNKTAEIHIKIDTGMSRIGFQPENASVEEIYNISKLPHIKISGMFTHFSTADEQDKQYTLLQKERLEFIRKALVGKGLSIPVHAANSAGIMDFDDLYYDMVRAGIILYGLYPSNEVKRENLTLKPVMSIKTQVSHVKTVGIGVAVGYGRHFITKRPTVIATVPVGYADGYIRAMSKGGRVLVKGQFAPVIGTVCMDQFMIDVTDIPNVMPGDEIVLMGRQGEKEITAEELAAIQGSISYEVVCLISKRVPREYWKNGKLLKTIELV